MRICFMQIWTYDVNALVPGDADLCALRTKIYADDTHGEVGLRSIDNGISGWGTAVDKDENTSQRRRALSSAEAR
jgi:hypothetical protein